MAGRAAAEAAHFFRRAGHALTDRQTFRTAMFGGAALATTLGGGKLADSIGDAYHGPLPKPFVTRIPGTDCLHITNPDGSTTLVGDCVPGGGYASPSGPTEGGNTAGGVAEAIFHPMNLLVVGGIALAYAFVRSRRK